MVRLFDKLHRLYHSLHNLNCGHTLRTHKLPQSVLSTSLNTCTKCMFLVFPKMCSKCMFGIIKHWDFGASYFWRKPATSCPVHWYLVMLEVLAEKKISVSCVCKLPHRHFASFCGVSFSPAFSKSLCKSPSGWF